MNTIQVIELFSGAFQPCTEELAQMLHNNGSRTMTSSRRSIDRELYEAVAAERIVRTKGKSASYRNVHRYTTKAVADAQGINGIPNNTKKPTYHNGNYARIRAVLAETPLTGYIDHDIDCLADSISHSSLQEAVELRACGSYARNWRSNLRHALQDHHNKMNDAVYDLTEIAAMQSE